MVDGSQPGHRFVETVANPAAESSGSPPDLNSEDNDVVVCTACRSAVATVRTVRHTVRKSQDHLISRNSSPLRRGCGSSPQRPTTNHASDFAYLPAVAGLFGEDWRHLPAIGLWREVEAVV